MERTLIFFDIDGTILTEDGRIPPSAAKAIHRLRTNGHLCYVNTGRPYGHINPAVKALGFDGYVCSCGQHVQIGDTALFHETFSPAQCADIAAKLRAWKLDAVYEFSHRVAFDSHRPERTELVIGKDYFRAIGITPEEFPVDFSEPFDKFCVWTHEGWDAEGFSRFLSPFCTIIDREGDLMEMTRKDCSKETGIRQVMAHYGVNAESCYAIGDSTNDLPMLRCVSHSIAMGNAPQEVKDAVEYVTASIDEDGLFRAMEHYHLL